MFFVLYNVSKVKENTEELVTQAKLNNETLVELKSISKTIKEIHATSCYKGIIKCQETSAAADCTLISFTPFLACTQSAVP